jgi:flagellar protein FliS
MLYDQLIKDLRRSAAAMREGRPEPCANEIKHALLVIQQLEGSLDRSTGEEFVTWLIRFYGLLRTRIVDAQVKRAPEELDAQIAVVLDIRSAWQEVELRNNSVATSSNSSSPMANCSTLGNSDGEYVTTNWSA